MTLCYDTLVPIYGLVVYTRLTISKYLIYKVRNISALFTDNDTFFIEHH